MKKVRYYSSFTDDFETSKNQQYKMPEDYKWVRTDFVFRVLSGIIYCLAVVFGAIYCRLFLHMRIKGRKNLKNINGDFFIYGNHTQPVGDVFIPALCVLPKRIFTVVSPANYCIPVIGNVLPFLGALPIADSLHGMRNFNAAIETRLKEGHPVVIYPEAHVWEYYTEIRPFPEASFKFPTKLDKSVFAMTVTYRKSKAFKRPIMEVWLDGPFCAQGDTVKEKTSDLHNKVYSAMLKRSQNSKYQYIEYIHK